MTGGLNLDSRIGVYQQFVARLETETDVNAKLLILAQCGQEFEVISSLSTAALEPQRELLEKTNALYLSALEKTHAELHSSGVAIAAARGVVSFLLQNYAGLAVREFAPVNLPIVDPQEEVLGEGRLEDLVNEKELNHQDQLDKTTIADFPFEVSQQYAFDVVTNLRHIKVVESLVTRVNSEGKVFYLVRSEKDQKATGLRKPNPEEDPLSDSCLVFPSDLKQTVIVPGEKATTYPVLRTYAQLQELASKDPRGVGRLANQLAIKEGNALNVPDREVEMTVFYDAKWDKTRLSPLPEESSYQVGYPYEASVTSICRVTGEDQKTIEGRIKFRDLHSRRITSGESVITLILIQNPTQEEKLRVPNGFRSGDDTQVIPQNPYTPLFTTKSTSFPYATGSKIVAELLNQTPDEVIATSRRIGLPMIVRPFGTEIQIKDRDDELKLLYGVKDVSIS
ncbi:hypothetical protein COY27_05190 [Candidatus Woesearchaeota archaeon CG_4_10_14_0_2_um_filter_33_13]|nr:MAG: hypothetical protein COY27_05190 [Candidatus Woesearchaeota archaeon CG_4_10_14_0_2_um_filter_33_13]